MKTSILSCILFAGLTACTGSGQVTYSAQAQAPQLVEVSPGVQVIADADEPIFYSDSYYWRNDNGVWMRSRSHTSGWERVNDVPQPIVTIERPQIYAHYHGEAHANLENNRVPVSAHEERKLQEEREKGVREQRKDAKEERKQWKEERKEQKQDRKEREDARD